MAITYTESWSQSFSEDLDTRELTIELHVVSDDDVLTTFNYQTATHATSGAAFPNKGDFRGEDPRYRLHRYSAPSFEGPRYAKVSTVWKTGPFGGEQEEDDPLNVGTRYRWRPVTQSEPTDADADGNPLLNSAGDPFAGTVPGYINTYIVEATRNEAAFDPAFAVSFQNKINQAAFQLAGQAINAGEALCTGIFPPSDYKLDDEYVPVTYQFEIRERLTLFNGQRLTAFCHRILDQGRRGWIYGTSKVAIYDRNGELSNPSPVAQDVPLDEGVPIGEPADSGKNFWSINPEFDPPDRGWEKNNRVSVPPLLAQDKSNDVNNPVTFLYYKRFQETDFSGLNL